MSDKTDLQELGDGGDEGGMDVNKLFSRPLSDSNIQAESQLNDEFEKALDLYGGDCQIALQAILTKIIARVSDKKASTASMRIEFDQLPEQLYMLRKTVTGWEFFTSTEDGTIILGGYFIKSTSFGETIATFHSFIKTITIRLI